ncbi:MAG: penicillin-binding transpeptidase domain-containing protein [Proteobacteria bacterium]|nr:penicillin-binding transpeptidase domain-containing protein [Pseudomonadota bacterium]
MRRMRRSTQKIWIKVTLASLLTVAAVLAWSWLSDMRGTPFLAQTLAYANEVAIAPPAAIAPIAVESGVHFQPSDIVWENDIAYVSLSKGRRAKLSLNRALQNNLDASLGAHTVPYGGAVVIDPKTGRVLAISSVSNANPKIDDYAMRAVAPSASVFKLISAAALLEKGSIDTQARVCYSGGQSMLSESDVRGNPSTDKTCANLEQAVAHSLNAVIARLAYQHLSKEDLEAISLRFAFNREIPFEMDVDVSQAEFVDDDIERAKTAAGFWHVNLSPMHGAMLAAAIVNQGVMMRPTLVDEITDANGTVIYTVKPQPWLVAMSAENAQTLARMGESTTREGTARSVFSGRKGWKKGVRTGGKTGTLSNKRPFYTFNWYVGWGEDSHADKLAVGALVVNSEKWWIKGTHVAARVMGVYFKD